MGVIKNREMQELEARATEKSQNNDDLSLMFPRKPKFFNRVSDNFRLTPDKWPGFNARYEPNPIGHSQRIVKEDSHRFLFVCPKTKKKF